MGGFHLNQMLSSYYFNFCSQDLTNAGAPISPAFDNSDEEHWVAIDTDGSVAEYETNFRALGFVCQYKGQ